MPPKEVFALLGRRSGRLHFQLSHGSSAEVHLHEGVLWSFQLNGRTAHEDGTLEIDLNNLLKQSEGEFEFSDAPPEDLERHFEITCGALLQTATRAEEDTEADAAEEVGEGVHASQHIPDKETRFTLDSASDDLSPSLTSFIEKCKHLLESGASAAEIAEVQGVPLTRVQIYLSRLRSHGVVKPVRAYQAKQIARSTSSKPSDAEPNSMARSDAEPSSAKRRPVFASAQTSQPTEAATQSFAGSFAGSHAEPPARRGLIRRLLAAIAPGGPK